MMVGVLQKPNTSSQPLLVALMTLTEARTRLTKDPSLWEGQDKETATGHVFTHALWTSMTKCVNSEVLELCWRPQ